MLTSDAELHQVKEAYRCIPRQGTDGIKFLYVTVSFSLGRGAPASSQIFSRRRLTPSDHSGHSFWAWQAEDFSVGAPLYL